MDKENTVVGNGVNHPDYYNKGEIECIDAIEAMNTNKDSLQGFCLGNAMKYLWRFPDKGGVQDLEKAIWYIHRVIDKEKR